MNARRGDHGDARVQRADPGRLIPAAARPGDGDALGIHVRSREEVVERADAVPHHPARHARAGERRQVPHHGVLSAHAVVAGVAGRDVPELAALALANRVPADHDVPQCRQSRGDALVALVGLADGRVTAGEEHGRTPPGRLVPLPACLRFWCVDHGGDVDAGDALEHDTLDAVPIELLAADDAGVQRRARLGQAADGVEHRAGESRSGARAVPPRTSTASSRACRTHPGPRRESTCARRYGVICGPGWRASPTSRAASGGWAEAAPRMTRRTGRAARALRSGGQAQGWRRGRARVGGTCRMICWSSVCVKRRRHRGRESPTRNGYCWTARKRNSVGRLLLCERAMHRQTSRNGEASGYLPKAVGEASRFADSLRLNHERRLVSREGIEPDPATSRN